MRCNFVTASNDNYALRRERVALLSVRCEIFDKASVETSFCFIIVSGGACFNFYLIIEP